MTTIRTASITLLCLTTAACSGGGGSEPVNAPASSTGTTQTYEKLNSIADKTSTIGGVALRVPGPT